MTPITPDEDVFYVVDFLRVAKTFDVVEKLQVQNKQWILLNNFTRDAYPPEVWSWWKGK